MPQVSAQAKQGIMREAFRSGRNLCSSPKSRPVQGGLPAPPGGAALPPRAQAGSRRQSAGDTACESFAGGKKARRGAEWAPCKGDTPAALGQGGDAFGKGRRGAKRQGIFKAAPARKGALSATAAKSRGRPFEPARAEGGGECGRDARL